MIHGCFHTNFSQAAGKDSSVAVGISILAAEHQELPTQTIGKDASRGELKQVHSSDTMTSASIGHASNKTVICCHMSGSCRGVSCYCHLVCAKFLHGMHEDGTENSLESFLHDENIEFLQQKVTFPYMFILQQDTELLSITSYGSRDFSYEWLQQGTYNIT